MQYKPNEKQGTKLIRQRLKSVGVSFKANDNISEYLTASDLGVIQEEVQGHIQALLEALIIDTDQDHNTKETAKRVAKMLVHETMSGHFCSAPKITSFPNAKGLDEMYTTGPITVRSLCSHHMQPILGKAWIGIIPDVNVIGLSKFNRIVDWFATRGQIQEELTVQIADYIMDKLQPKGLAVVIKATHGCMICRGVKEAAEATMTTSVMRGKLIENPAARAEFFELIKIGG